MNARREMELLRVLTLARTLVNDPANSTGALLALTDAVRLADDTQEPVLPTDRQIFSHLLNAGPLPMFEVAEALGMSPQTVKNSILRLERRGLIVTKRKTFRRICWVAEGAA